MTQTLIQLRAKAGDYRLRNFKNNGIGMEGHSWFATLYRGNTKLGRVIDYATGGPLDIEVRGPELAALVEYAKKDPENGRFEPAESFVGITLLELVEIEKQLQREAKKAVLFTLPGDAPDQYHVLNFKGVGSPDLGKGEEWLARKYGAGNFTVLNAML